MSQALYVIFILFGRGLDAGGSLKKQFKDAGARQSAHSNLHTEEPEVELCRVAGSHAGEHPLSVRLLPNNRRTMYLTAANATDIEVETEIQCLGEIPSSCKRGHGVCTPCPCKMDPHSLPDSYVELMLQEIMPRCKAMPPDGQDIQVLLIGLGGGALPQQILAQCPAGSITVHAVEIDERVIQMARQYFGLPKNRHLEVEHADATEALKTRFGKNSNVFLQADGGARKLYDIALVDCMAGSGAVPLPCRSAQFVELLHKALRKGGLAMQNIWHYAASAPHKIAAEFRQTKAEYKRVFGDVRSKRPENPPDIDWQDLLLAMK